MLTFILKILGLNPKGNGKTGKREAAWGLVFIALGVTIVVIYQGAEMMSAAVGVLVILWPSAILAVAGAYKLEHDKKLLAGGDGQGKDAPGVMEAPGVSETGMMAG